MFDDERLLSAPLKHIARYITDAVGQQTVENAKTEQVFLQVAEQCRTRFVAIPSSYYAWGAIHGDLRQGNCHFDADMVEGGNTGRSNCRTFFDFSNAVVGFRAYDLCGLLWPLRDDTARKDPSIAAACDAFSDGYRSVRPLSDEEELALPAFIKERDFWETGTWLQHDANADPKVVVDGLHSLARQFTQFPLL